MYHAHIMTKRGGPVKVQNTRDLQVLGMALVDLLGFLNSPQRDEALLREAGVTLDRALFPLLVAVGRRGSLGVAELGELVGRDHTTVSRQLAKLELLSLVQRSGGTEDRRRRDAILTEAGSSVVSAITAARMRLLGRALAEWNEPEIAGLAFHLRHFADALAGAARGAG
jgi:DNA-binding MarR family transcriptional regulator